MIDQEATELLRHMEHWGYDLADPPHPRSPGYGRLLVAIRRTPTEDHYDPEAIQLHLCSAQGPPARTTIHLDTSLDGPARVSAGHVELTDRFNKRRGFMPERLFYIKAQADVNQSATSDVRGDRDEARNAKGECVYFPDSAPPGYPAMCFISEVKAKAECFSWFQKHGRSRLECHCCSPVL